MVRWFSLAATTGACAWLVVTGTAHAQTCATPGNVATACSGDCATITAPQVNGARGSTVDIALSFAQGPDSAPTGQGFDEVSAIAFTLGVPGTGDADPLLFDCTDGNLADGSVAVPAAIAEVFTVVVENAQCTNRNRCLCPGEGQERDNFVNIVVYGPSNLPEQGPVEIPVLPDSGNIVTLRMRVAGDAPNTVPLHFFSGLDSSKPQFAANLSIGDQAACDVTANSSNRSNVAFTHGQVTVSGEPTDCVGDCNGDGNVAINELITGVNIALGNTPVANCPAFDPNSNDDVSIAELIQAVNNSLNGCPE